MASNLTHPNHKHHATLLQEFSSYHRFPLGARYICSPKGSWSPIVTQVEICCLFLSGNSEGEAGLGVVGACVERRDDEGLGPRPRERVGTEGDNIYQA